MWKFLDVENGHEQRLAHNPLLLVSLSTSNPQFALLYSQARLLATFLLRKLSFKRIASLYSSAMPPAIDIGEEGIIEPIGVHFYHHFGGKRDLVLLAGHSSPLGEEYEFGDSVLSFARKIGVLELVSVGARWTEEPVSPFEMPKVLGYSSDEGGVNKLREMGVEIQKQESAYYFANVIVAMSSNYGMSGYKLSVNHGEPTPHPKAIMALSSIISKMIEEPIPTDELEAEAQQLEKLIKDSKLEGFAGQEGMGTMKQGDIYR
jgi:proteasome assembly chaperone (PAC2) family protein